METLVMLQRYMGSRRWMLPAALLTSALSALVGMVPFLCIWGIVRLLLQASHDGGSVTSLGLWAAGSAAGSVLLYFLALMLSHLAAFRVEVRMRSAAMHAIVSMPLGFFDRHTIGRIRKMVDTNASITHSFLAHQLPDLAGTFLVPSATLVLLLYFDWRIGIASLVPVVFSLALMRGMSGSRGKGFMSSYMSALEEMNTEAVEYVRGIPVVKVFQQTVYSFKSFHGSIQRYKEMVTAYTRLWEKPMSLYLVLINGTVFFIVPTAVFLIADAQDPNRILRDLFLYALITPVFGKCIMRSAYLGQAQGQAREAARRMEELLEHEPLRESRAPRALEGTTVSFQDVSFRYPGTAGNAIEGIGFEIPQGTVTALVGASGSGKTTIARLVPRFWDAVTGQVRIGGIDVRDISPVELMRNVSFVFQNTRLFKTSLRDNLLYGNPGASTLEIETALEAAQCREIVEKFPQGLDTRIGSDGVYLSGGEQQRIVLARAMLKNAPIVVLDEATAFADPENEHLIQEAMARLVAGKTVLMIAHRLTSIRQADQILVLERGRIVEKGTHPQLRALGGRYSRMWDEYRSSAAWTIKTEGGAAC